MKTRKTKKRNIIRRTVAFLLCMTMVLGLGMQDVIEQVYAEEAIPVIEQEAATEEAGELTTEGAGPEENAETAEEPDESVEEAEEQPANSTPSQPADAEENTKTDVPSAPAENAGSEEGEKQNPSAPAEDGQSGSDSETSAETNPGGNTGNEITAPTEDENTVTNPDETTGEDTEDDAAVSDEEEETTEPEEKVTELTYAAEDRSFSVTAAAVGEDTDLSSYELHAAQVQKDGEEADRYAAAEELIAGALDAESRRIEELQAYDIWFTYTESGETADLSGQVQISLEYTAPEFPEGTDAQLEVFCLNGGAAEAVDGTDALAAGCELYALAWAVPAGYEKTWEDGQVIIRVTAEEGVLPAGAELSVTPIVKTEDMGSLTEEQQNAAEEINAQYDLTEKKLNEEVEENGETLGGFLAYDISFLVNGEKTEPNGNVSVTMEFKEAVLPEGVSEDARVSVKHLKEDAEAEDGIAVEDVSEKAEVQNTENAAVEKVMLSADSFSTYAITWAYPGSPSITDEVINEDSLLATWNGGGYVVGYNWYRSDSEKGDYQLVGKISYEGGVSNLSENGERLYPAYDQGARKWYKVEAVFEDGTKSSWSDAFQVPYYNELQNGDFETPANRKYNNYTGGYTPVTMTQVSNGEYKEEGIWQTTGTNNGKDIEILGAGEIIDWNETDGLSEYYAWQQGQQPAAAKGVQFAEINCEEAGALYQDVLTIPGTTLNYSLSHRARGNNKRDTEYDTMFLVIMPTEESQDLTTQEELEAKLAAYGVDVDKEYSTDHEAEKILYNQGGVLIMQITSDDQDWHHIDMETYTPTSSVTRFFFVSGSTDAERDDNRDDQGNPNGNTIGNFLDAVWFSQDLPPVADDEFTLEIKKEFEGLSQAEIEEVRQKIQFTISAERSNGTELTDEEINAAFGVKVISGTDMTKAPDGSLSYSIANKEISESYKVTVTESNAVLEGGYTLTTSSEISVRVGDGEPNVSTGTGDAVIPELKGETVAQVTFTNTYIREQKKDVNFTKVWDDDGNAYGTRPDSVRIELHAKAGETDLDEWLDAQGVDRSQELRGSSSGNYWRGVWEDVPVYYTPEGGEAIAIDYTVTEEGHNNGSYVYEAQNGGTAQVGDGSDYDMTVKGLTKADTNGVSTNAASFAAAASSSGSELGEPGHNKYIVYDEATGKYTLNLDVVGAKGNAKGVDVLFVIDKSASMAGGLFYKGLLSKVQDLLTKRDGIIDQIFEADGNVNSVAYVAFSSMKGTTTSRWYNETGSDDFKELVNDLRANGGTNWTFAMQKASDLLESRKDNGNAKVVIFLSDGAPTFSMGYEDGEYGETGNGSSERNSYRTDAANVVNQSGTLQAAAMYSVYLNNNTKDGMQDFDTQLKNHTNHHLVDGNDLGSALEDILKNEIPTYKNVEITDVLSGYVEFVEESSSITVTKKAANGVATPLDPGDYKASVSGGVVRVKLLNGASLDAGATYTVSFEVKPSEQALNEYAKDGYKHIGEPGTGDTSDAKEGFFSNDSAYVSYTVNDEEDKADYKRPVIQVPENKTIDITVQKEWRDGGPQSEVEVALYQSINSGEATVVGESIKLNDGNSWKYTWEGLPLSQNGDEYDYAVNEITDLEGYTCTTSIDKTDPEHWIVTIINSYDENSADENYYIVNVLQTEKITINKSWDDNNNSLGKRPSSINVKIQDAAGKTYNVPVVGDQWKAEITVPKAQNATYTATESEIADYETTGAVISGEGSGNVTISFTNKLKVKTITVKKEWNDGDIKDRPGNITFKLCYYDENTWKVWGTYTLSSDENWSMRIENLPAYYTYRVQEINVSGGYVSGDPVYDEPTSTFTITNTLDWTAKKMSHPLNGEANGSPLKGAEFELRDPSDNVIATGISQENGEIIWEPKQGAESNLNGLHGIYKIVETKAPAGYQIAEVPWTVEFNEGLLIKVNDKPVLGNAEDGIVLTLENEILYELPETGGPGIYLYMLGGVALMMAGTLLVYKKRKEEVLGS